MRKSNVLTEIEQTFKKKLADYSDYFSFVCFFGSLNIKNDLDIFIIPKKNCKKGFFMKKLILLLEGVKKDLNVKKINSTIIWHSTYEEEVKYLNRKKNTIKIHISSFPDIHPTTIPDYLPFLQKSEKVLLGNYKSVLQMKKTKIDYFYNYLFISNCLLSNYPKKLEKEKIFSKINHIYKHLIGKKKKLSGSTKKQFFECCDFLDKII